MTRSTLITFLLAVFTCAVGALVPLWFRAVTTAGDHFSFRIFLAENQGRLLLIGIGVLLIQLLMLADPAGLSSLLSQAGLPVEITSNAVIGAAITALVLAKGKSE
ncbi:MAG TPA: hypothetical protein PKO33_00110 [Pyrinomonadaceae bacterium]|nr:hypothetical protein [Pyrinomonadaceae bacterium]